jgi:predicted membrane protein
MILAMPDSTRPRERSAAELSTREASDLEQRHRDEVVVEELESETLIAVLGNSSRKGEWEPADITRVFVFCGQANLDFTRALLPSGITEVQAFTLCGSANIVVPEGLEVEVTGTGLMGEFTQSAQVSRARRFIRRTLRAARGELPEEDDFPPEEDPPILRVTGLALMGSVKVVTR